jgi:hypothetical protein
MKEAGKSLRLVLLALVTTVAPTAALESSVETLTALAKKAVFAEPAEARAAIASLRAEGLPGLDALLALREPAWPWICWDNSGGKPSDAGHLRWCDAVDRVAAQRDASVSKLYWHTEIQSAMEEARKSGKPILSLRLLGRLDEEYSCANSRFFRAALYSNRPISSLLRERFVLHWEMVQPVPRITIDFGDGRRIEQTLTGNSVHYVLTASGQPLDALPGFYSPHAFLRWLKTTENLARTFAAEVNMGAVYHLRFHHLERWKQLEKERRADQSRVASWLDLWVNRRDPHKHLLRAVDASMLSETKSGGEGAVLRAFAEAGPDMTAVDEDTWSRIGALHALEANLDPFAKALLARERRNRPILQSAEREFELSMARDTVRNEFLLHSWIHRWFIARLWETGDVNDLNEKIYAEIFLMPRSDPWLGLLPAGAYTALSRPVRNPG